MKLSVITVNLNNVQGLVKTGSSIISQTFSDMEWIIIDGGSGDGSIDYIRSNETKVKYWVSEADSGIYSAMNKGIKKAEGEYCLFLNSGDYLLNDRSLADFFNLSFSEDIVSGNMLVGRQGIVSEKCTGKTQLSFLDVYLSTIKHQSAFIRRDLFGRFGFYDEELKIVADYEFFLKTAGFGGASYRYIDKDITWFDNDGISYNNPELVEAEKMLVRKRNLPPVLVSDLDQLIKYRNIRYIDQNPVSRFLFRILGSSARVLFKGSIK
jgi:glycosyltransferase involved in cell wall biosynthesis